MIHSQNALLERCPRRTDDPLRPSRRLYPLRAAPHQQRVTQLLIAKLDRAHLLGEPGRQFVLITPSELTEPEGRPDLDSVPLDRARRPLISDKPVDVDLHLLGDVCHGLGGNSAAELESEPRGRRTSTAREPESRRARLVANQPPVVVDQRPGANDVLGRPIDTHEAEP